jgi:hypothetical protein
MEGGIEYMNRRPRNPLFIKAQWLLYETPAYMKELWILPTSFIHSFRLLGINNDDYPK